MSRPGGPFAAADWAIPRRRAIGRPLWQARLSMGERDKASVTRTVNNSVVYGVIIFPVRCAAPPLPRGVKGLGVAAGRRSDCKMPDLLCTVGGHCRASHVAPRLLE